MSGIVEFIIKMQDGITAPLGRLSGQSHTANKSLKELTASNKQLTGMLGASSHSVTTLTSRVEKLKSFRDILPANATGRIKEVNREISLLNKEIDHLQNIGQSKGIKEKFDSLFNSLPSILRNPFVLAGAGVAGALNAGLKNSGDRLDFKLLLGDDVGSDLFDSIKKGAPASMRDTFLQGGKDLLSSGVDTESVESLLSQIGDISMGSDDKFGGLLSSFTAIKKEGKLTESTLQQLSDAGFRPLVSLSKATGESLDSLEKRFEAGKISADDISIAFQSATSSGGEFEGKLQEIANSPTGKWDIFKTKVFDLSSAFGETLLPIMSKGLDVLTIGIDWLSDGIDRSVNLLSSMSEWLDENSTLMYTLAGAVLGGVVAYKAYQLVSMAVYMWQMRDLVATSLLATAKGGLTVVTGGLAIAQTALNAAFIASPIGWVVGGLALLAGGVVFAWNKFEGFRKVVYGLWDAFKETFNSIGRLFKHIFSPIFDAITAIKEGRWKDAALSAGKMVYNLTPMGLATATAEFTKSGGFDGISKAFGEGAEKGAASWQATQDKKESKEDDPFSGSKSSGLLDYLKQHDRKNKGKSDTSLNTGVSAVSGGGAKSYVIQIGKMWDNTEFVIQDGNKQMARDLQRIMEETMMRVLASASAK